MGSKKDAGRDFTPDVVVTLFRDRLSTVRQQLELPSSHGAFAYVFEQMVTFMVVNLTSGITETRLPYEAWAVLANERGKGKRGTGDFLKKPFTQYAGIYGDLRKARGDGWRVEVEIVTPGVRRGSGAGMVARFYRAGDAPCVVFAGRRAIDAATIAHGNAVLRAERLADIERRVDAIRHGIEAVQTTTVEKRRMRREVREIAAHARDVVLGKYDDEKASFRSPPRFDGYDKLRVELRTFADLYWSPRRSRGKSWVNPNAREELRELFKKKP